MQANRVFVGLLCAMSAACGANSRSLPIASAIIVHGCAAAEADTYLRSGNPGGYAVSEVAISLKTSGEGKGSAIWSGLGLEAVRGAEKVAELKLTKLPTMAQCKAWGYVLQLGAHGCLLGSPAIPCSATSEFPKDVPVQ